VYRPAARPPLRAAAAGVAAVAAVVGLTGCGSSGSGSTRDALLDLPVPSSVTVTTRTVAGLGTILVDGAGRALYLFPPDAHSHVSCTGACAGIWPPLVIADGHHATAGRGVRAAELGTVADPNTGARAVTYAGYPLYRYSGDLAAGDARGQALVNSGGPWYVLSPDGKPIVTHPAGTP